MDPITLAAAATSLLAPFIKKAGTVALDKLAEQLPDTVGKVWIALSNRASALTEAATEIANNPDDAENEVVFKKQLQKVLEKDPDFASLLTDLLEKANGVQATNNSIAIRDINISGDLNGDFTIGSNNQINSR